MEMVLQIKDSLPKHGILLIFGSFQLFIFVKIISTAWVPPARGHHQIPNIMLEEINVQDCYSTVKTISI